MRMIAVKIYHLRHEAELAQGLLESHGVGSLISSPDCGGMRPDFAYGLGGIKLLVEKSAVEEARAILGEDS